MQTENENGLEFLDLRLKLKDCNKVTLDVYSKPTNSLHTSTLRSCYSSRNIHKIPEGIALKLGCIC